MSNGVKRDFASIESRKFHPGTKRPLWNGPVPNRYYYSVKNKKRSNASFVVLFSDQHRFEHFVRQITCSKDGKWSLIESDVPLPIRPRDGKMLTHSKVEQVKAKLFKSHDRASEIIDPNEEHLVIEGTPIVEKDIFI